MDIPIVVVSVLWAWIPLVGVGALAGWCLGLRTGWKSKKFIDLRIKHKGAQSLTPDQYEVSVDDRKYLVNCIEEIPEPDRTLVRAKSLSSIDWERHFLRTDGTQLLAECGSCKKKWYPHQGHDFAKCATPVKVLGKNADSWHPSDDESDTLSEFPKAERALVFPSSEMPLPESGVIKTR